MALIIDATLTIDTANEVLTVTDTTGTGATGYGTGTNRDVTDNVGTDFDFIFPDLSTYIYTVDGSTLPTTDFIPFNALTRPITTTQASLTSDTFGTGVTIMTYRPYFTTISAGNYSVVNGSATITRASGQSPATDFSDSDIIMLAGVKYTIASKTATTLVLTEVYAGVTNAALATCYIAYEKRLAVMGNLAFLSCWSPQIAQLKWDKLCSTSPNYVALRNLYSMYLQILDKMTLLDYEGANLQLIEATAQCTCVRLNGAKGCGCGC